VGVGVTHASFAAEVQSNPADPYMTLVAYFNALRELGSARRIVEDEVRTRVSGYASRTRIGEAAPRFADRDLKDPLELTSREDTAKVADAKERLALGFDGDRTVDMALATNMISVELDVIRLGLMLVSGQPKTAAEYIQATSRVGRDRDRPGLVVTLLNLNKPRDRSHYEHFTSWHAAFYRAVEAVSVTPFASRALDRRLAPATVALARLGRSSLTPLTAAGAAERERTALDQVIEAFGQRARDHRQDAPAELEDQGAGHGSQSARRLGIAGPRPKRRWHHLWICSAARCHQGPAARDARSRARAG
jgi:hypothetical protein